MGPKGEDAMSNNEFMSHAAENVSSHVSHDTPDARYRKPVVLSDQRRCSADTTSLNPTDAWPFSRSEPETDQDWRKNAPEAPV
jgi:hypothetical protein